jgi:threonine synthase
MMSGLGKEGHYTITAAMKERLSDFCGGYATEAETADTIKRVYQQSGYILDPHTAVAACVYDKYYQNGVKAKTVIAATASPYKFLRSVMTAISSNGLEGDDFSLIDQLYYLSGITIPAAIKEITEAPIRHKGVCEVTEMPQIIYQFLQI